MKPATLILVSSLLFCSVQILSCSKTEEPAPDPVIKKDTAVVPSSKDTLLITDTTLTLKLSDKPLDTIRKYTKGEWKLQYASGGICGTCTTSYAKDNYFWTFSEPDRIAIRYNGNLNTDGPITWLGSKNAYGDSAQILYFEDKRSYPYFYVPDKIFKDTLILYNDGSDARSYYFTKVK